MLVIFYVFGWEKWYNIWRAIMVKLLTEETLWKQNLYFTTFFEGFYYFMFYIYVFNPSEIYFYMWHKNNSI